jgi:hypothetical protein
MSERRSLIPPVGEIHLELVRNANEERLLRELLRLSVREQQLREEQEAKARERRERQ